MREAKIEDNDDDVEISEQIPPPKLIQCQDAAKVNVIPNRDQVLAWVLDNCA